MILRLCLVFQLVVSCSWSPVFAETSDAAASAVNSASIDATTDGVAKIEKIKIASVDSVVDEEKQKNKKSKLKPVKLPRAEAKLIASSDSKPADAAEEKDADGKPKYRWFRRVKTDEEKAIADAKVKADEDARAKKEADEKAGKELAKKAAAEAKAQAKAEKAGAKKEKESKAEDKPEAATVPAVTTPAAQATPVTQVSLAATAPATSAAPATETKVVGTDAAAAPVTSGDGKLVAAKAPVENKEAVKTAAAAPASSQKQTANIELASGEGLGGFVSAEDQKELAFLQEGRVEETIGDLNVIVIDNDEVLEVDETIAYEELPTDEGKTRIKTGAQFPVVLSSQMSSETAKEGDIVQARLKYDLKIGNKLVAKKGDLVRGRVTYKMKARSVMHSLVSPNRWYRNSGVLGFQFEEIINGKGEHIALNAKPARKGNIIKNKAEGRLLGVNHNGEITGPWAQQLRWKAVRIGMNFAMAPAGVFSFGAMPVALGVMGAINPSFAFMKPVGTNVPHRRIKGFFWGALSGVPGSWIIEDTVTKGQPAIVKPGDEFLVELQQEFTGEAVTSAQMLPGAGANVSSEVEGATKKDTVKGKKTKKK